ncbi:hypothetical protein COCSADRAFT_41314 [Bipolaris sorokiniana ND90Pr]|uniref:Peptide hydrolase n=1 Tax=Cochliobolus sativus (strain ND90Pr / ATCC 201652) TaxID=665912 RepID=M2RWM3_COCSN|nr:uncharacterized protein COCSADRAFT_41314 [Bipolaris sorokiniana ND90Pr]EMD59473.1 hypothetical protein COCSADRAFT_41314 [Bipolaris sorokiniana ND90Pr]
MKSLGLLATVCATAALAKGPERVSNAARSITIEVAPGETRQITEDERWDIATGGGCGSHFFDITDSFAEPIAVTRAAAYPTTFQYGANIRRLFPSLSWANIKKNLEQYSTFHTRFSETQSGADAAQWLLAQVQAVVKQANKPGVTASAFPHSLWPQNSIIARIQGRSNRTVVVGAHLDSINSANRLTGRAPGVDDDGSGSMLLLEALRVLLTDSAFAGSNSLLENTIEFHWYAAEEGGLRGSQDIFTQYKNAGRDIWAMLQQDMVGYTKGTLNAGKPESFGLITDFTDAVLNRYLVGVIGEYTDITYVNSTCGYACSDHGSAMRSGYPASFVFESDFRYRNPYIHTANDTMEHMDPNHVLQHGRLVLGYLYELGFSKA